MRRVIAAGGLSAYVHGWASAWFVDNSEPNYAWVCGLAAAASVIIVIGGLIAVDVNR